MSRGVTISPGAAVPKAAASTTVGTPMEMIGIPSSLGDSAGRLFPIPEPDKAEAIVNDIELEADENGFVIRFQKFVN